MYKMGSSYIIMYECVLAVGQLMDDN